MRLRSPIPGTLFELTEAGIVTKYKKTPRGLLAWFRQYFCSHPNEEQKVDNYGILCRKCGWARTARKLGDVKFPKGDQVTKVLNAYIGHTVTVRKGDGSAVGTLAPSGIGTYAVENKHAGGTNALPRVEFLPDAVEKVTVEQPSPGVTDTVIELR